MTVITGDVVSFTVTGCGAEACRPAPSVAVQTTVVVPTGKMWLAGMPVALMVTGEQVSAPAAWPMSSGPAAQVVAPGPVPAVNGGGAVIVGGVVSTTWTIRSAAAVLPARSATE